jgi:hypothetical protein
MNASTITIQHNERSGERKGKKKQFFFFGSTVSKQTRQRKITTQQHHHQQQIEHNCFFDLSIRLLTVVANSS